MDNIPYFVLLSHLITIVCAIITLWLASNILFYFFTAYVVPFSPADIIFLLCWILWAIFSIVYCLYIICLWHPEAIRYNQMILFFIGFCSEIMHFINILASAMLGIDRCISILYPQKYGKSEKKFFGFMIFLYLLGYFVIIMLLNNYIKMIPYNPKILCGFYACILDQHPRPYSYFTKFLGTFINAFVGCVLYFLIKRCCINPVSINSTTRKMHKTILLLILSTTVFETLPDIFAEVFKMVSGASLSSFIGPYDQPLSAINFAFCIILYFQTITNSLKKVDICPNIIIVE